jgi:hypothetical protein
MFEQVEKYQETRTVIKGNKLKNSESKRSKTLKRKKKKVQNGENRNHKF